MKITKEGVKLAQRLETPKRLSISKPKKSEFQRILESFDATVYGNTNHTPYARLYSGSENVQSELKNVTFGLPSRCAISMLEETSKIRNFFKGCRTYPDLLLDVTKKEFCVLA